MSLSYRIVQLGNGAESDFIVWYQLNFYSGMHQLFNPAVLQKPWHNETGFEFTDASDSCFFLCFLEDFLNGKPARYGNIEPPEVVFEFIKNINSGQPHPTGAMFNYEPTVRTPFISLYDDYNSETIIDWLKIKLPGHFFKQESRKGKCYYPPSLSFYLPIEKEQVAVFYEQLKKEWNEAKDWMYSMSRSEKYYNW